MSVHRINAPFYSLSTTMTAAALPRNIHAVVFHLKSNKNISISGGGYLEKKYR
jgi:hypothetical protein